MLHCPIKTDSGPVVSELWNSGNQVVMITGDAIYTAAEVARQVGIIRKTGKTFPDTLQLKHSPRGMEEGNGEGFRGEFRFVALSSNVQTDAQNLTLTTTHIDKLKKLVAERKIAICVSGDALQKLVVLDHNFQFEICLFDVLFLLPASWISLCTLNPAVSLVHHFKALELLSEIRQR